MKTKKYFITIFLTFISLFLFISFINAEDFPTARASAVKTLEEGRFKVEYPPRVRAGEKFQIKVFVRGYARIYEYFVDGQRECDSWSWQAYNKTYAHPHKHKNPLSYSHFTKDRLAPSTSEEYYDFTEPGEHNFMIRIIHCQDPDYSLCSHGRLKSSVKWTIKVI